MKKYILTAKEDGISGELGYVVDGIHAGSEITATSEGSIIAHDLLEHVNGIEKIGSLDDELEAIAGIWFIRGQFNDLSRKGYGSMHSPEKNLASDVVYMARIYNNGVDFRTKIPKTNKSDMDDVWSDIIEQAKSLVRDEIIEEFRNSERLKEYFDACIHYMRKGWQKTNKRFNSSIQANRLFWKIADTIEPFMSPEYEGQQISLRFEMSSCNVYVDEFYDEYDYY